MSNPQYQGPNIDGLKIINREPGWEEEWRKTVAVLFTSNGINMDGVIPSKAVRIIRREYRFRPGIDISGRVNDFVSFVFLEYSKYGAAQYDDQGKAIPMHLGFDPDECSSSDYPPFVVYLSNPVHLHHLYQRFSNCERNDADKSKQIQIMRLKRRGKLECWTPEELTRQIQKAETDNGDFDLNQAESARSVCKEDDRLQYVIDLYACNLGVQCCNNTADSKINVVYSQSGIQLYQEYRRLRDLASGLSSVASLNEKALCGIIWITDKTLAAVQAANPDQCPKTLLGQYCQQALEQYTANKTNGSLLSDNLMKTITKDPMLCYYFTPIGRPKDIADLLGIQGKDLRTRENNATQALRRYRLDICHWLEKNVTELETVLTLNK